MMEVKSFDALGITALDALAASPFDKRPLKLATTFGYVLDITGFAASGRLIVVYADIEL